VSVHGGADPGLGAVAPTVQHAPSRARTALTGGGTGGNEELTARTGVFLVVLLAVLGVTIIGIGQFIWLHLFLGLLLLGPVALKMGSTGYRFARYYTRNQTYRDKGPPELLLRLLAPSVVITTVIVFVSGIVLLFEGPKSRGIWLSLHKVSFFVWLAPMALHVLGHLPRLPRKLRAVEPVESLGGTPPGQAGRWILLAGSVVAGAVLAIVLLPDFGVWTAPGALHHHHHGG
jgi:hypothetical protein